MNSGVVPWIVVVVGHSHAVCGGLPPLPICLMSSGLVSGLFVEPADLLQGTLGLYEKRIGCGVS